MKQTGKRLLALLLLLTMCLSLFPATAFAEEAEELDDPAPTEETIAISLEHPVLNCWEGVF